MLKEWYFQPTKVIVKAQRKRKYKLKVQQKGFFVHTSSLVPWFQTFQPVVGKGIADRVPGLDFIGKVKKGCSLSFIMVPYKLKVLCGNVINVMDTTLTV